MQGPFESVASPSKEKICPLLLMLHYLCTFQEEWEGPLVGQVDAFVSTKPNVQDNCILELPHPKRLDQCLHD